MYSFRTGHVLFARHCIRLQDQKRAMMFEDHVLVREMIKYIHNINKQWL